MYLKMRKVKSSKIYTQEWHRTRKVDSMEGIAKWDVGEGVVVMIFEGDSARVEFA